MKIILGLILLAFVFVPVADAKTVIKVSTTGNAKVNVQSTSITSSTNVVTKSCTVSIVKSTNGKGRVIVKGVKTCK